LSFSVRRKGALLKRVEKLALTWKEFRQWVKPSKMGMGAKLQSFLESLDDFCYGELRRVFGQRLSVSLAFRVQGGSLPIKNCYGYVLEKMPC
jgi:hypothetical protein